MNESDNSSKAAPDDMVLREAASPYKLDLPRAPDFPSDGPKGTWEDGYRLSVAALERVKNRPEIFVQRDQRMCSKEFKL